MELIIEWEVNQTSGQETISLEELGYNFLQEWANVPHEEKQIKLQDCLDKMPPRCCSIVAAWREAQ